MRSYRKISLLNFDSKRSEKCAQDPHFGSIFFTQMTRNQHGFVRKLSAVLSNTLQFLQDVHRALNNHFNESAVAFYAKFSKAFDLVSYKLPLQKLEKLELAAYYLTIRSTTWKDANSLYNWKTNAQKSYHCQEAYPKNYSWGAPVRYLWKRFIQNHEIQWTISIRRWLEKFCEGKSTSNI